MREIELLDIRRRIESLEKISELRDETIELYNEVIELRELELELLRAQEVALLCEQETGLYYKELEAEGEKTES
jgi:hypothetical protein